LLLAFSSPVVGGRTVDRLFDPVELADVVERLLGDREAIAACTSKNLRRTCAQQAASAICPPANSSLNPAYPSA